LYAVVGGLGIAIGIVLFLNAKTPSNENSSTTGTVVSASFAGGAGCVNVATFSVRGRVYRASSSVASARTCQYKVGTEVPVAYALANPSEANIPAQSPYRLFGPAIFTLAGLVFAVVGILTISKGQAEQE
jgi:uncharacterized protein DUF3592